MLSLINLNGLMSPRYFEWRMTLKINVPTISILAVNHPLINSMWLINKLGFTERVNSLSRVL